MLLPWKTASQSSVIRLAHLDQSPYSKFFSFNTYLNRVVHQHLTCADYVNLPEAKLGYFLASFIRNPYDRVYSGFHQIQRDFHAQPHLKYDQAWIKELVAHQLQENIRMMIEANYQFDNWVNLLDEHHIYEQGRNTNLPLHPAHYWTHLAGKKVVQFIGKVENFDSDISTLASLLDLGNLSRTNSNTNELNTQSSLGPVGYRYADRMSSSSIRKINLLFKDDFELFGYPKIDA